jgi:5-formyltetrahydrofolate cyclo-ligase
MTPKAELRARMLAVRKAMTPDPANAAAAAARLEALPEIARARRIAVYLSVRNELDTRALIAKWLAEGREIGAPRVADGFIEIAPLEDLGALKPGQLGIPVCDGPTWDRFDAAVVPGVAFTVRGERLGMGKGYYDGLLAKHPEAFTVGFCHDEQLVEELPMEPHDQRLRAIVTPTRTIRV